MIKYEEIPKYFFAEKGFFAEKIIESDDKSPDFFVKDNKNSYLVEFKIKEESGGLTQEREQTLRNGAIFSVEKSLDRNNTISGRISKSSEQLSENIASGLKADFRIIWYHAFGRFPEVNFHQIKSTIYGSVDIIVLGENSPSLPCLYFTFNDFCRYKDFLDAAIITYTDKAQFCLNNYSPNYEKIKNTNLFNIFSGGIYDPLLEESKGKAYIADCDIDRREEHKVLQYIQNKYKKQKMINMNMKFFSAEAAINHGG